MTVRSSVVGFGYQRLLRPLLFASDPESIHEQMIGVLARVGSVAPARGLLRLVAGTHGPETTVAGIQFPGRVGLAAGMDKDGHAVRAWRSLGFAFAELGTVTAQAQPGNDRPRLFRLPTSGALINRMGFNNVGAAALAATLAKAGVYRGNRGAGIPIGVSIGKTKSAPVEDATADYLTSLEAVAPHADYVAVNVSSPNTPGLRDLQSASLLADLLKALTSRAEELATKLASAPLPIFVKLAPDLAWPDVDTLLEVCERSGAAGVIATNTTLSRDGLAPADQPRAAEPGGLSGSPLTERARAVVQHVAKHTNLPVIGSGGVMTPEDAWALLDAGAQLVQLCTGFIYAGPALAQQIESRRS